MDNVQTFITDRNILPCANGTKTASSLGTETASSLDAASASDLLLLLLVILIIISGERTAVYN